MLIQIKHHLPAIIITQQPPVVLSGDWREAMPPPPPPPRLLQQRHFMTRSHKVLVTATNRVSLSVLESSDRFNAFPLLSISLYFSSFQRCTTAPAALLVIWKFVFRFFSLGYFVYSRFSFSFLFFSSLFLFSFLFSFEKCVAPREEKIATHEHF